jgi:hypothetical protein
MNKPLKDWTLAEVQEHCKATGCCKCPFQSCDVECALSKCVPSWWDLTDLPRFTEQEVEDAKVLMRAFPSGNYTQVHRHKADIKLCLKCEDNPYKTILLDYAMFPSVKEGETVSLAEIAGCEDGQQNN